MKKYIIIILALLLAAAVVWCVLMDPVSVSKTEVASIDVRFTSYRVGEFGQSEKYEDAFTITDEDHIRYICDALNSILPIPGTPEYNTAYKMLTLRNAAGQTIAEVTLLANDYLVTAKGTFRADVGELSRNISNIRLPC